MIPNTWAVNKLKLNVIQDSILTKKKTKQNKTVFYNVISALCWPSCILYIMWPLQLSLLAVSRQKQDLHGGENSERCTCTWGSWPACGRSTSRWCNPWRLALKQLCLLRFLHSSDRRARPEDWGNRGKTPTSIIITVLTRNAEMYCFVHT